MFFPVFLYLYLNLVFLMSLSGKSQFYMTLLIYRKYRYSYSHGIARGQLLPKQWGSWEPRGIPRWPEHGPCHLGPIPRAKEGAGQVGWRRPSPESVMRQVWNQTGKSGSDQGSDSPVTARQVNSNKAGPTSSREESPQVRTNKVHSQPTGTAVTGLQTDPPLVSAGWWPQVKLKWGFWVHSGTGGGPRGECWGPESPP